MVTLLTCIHVFVCIFLMLTVLLQSGKGGGMGAALGGQTSTQVFGGRGAGSFLERLTVGAAVIFMVTSMSLAYVATQSESKRLKEISAKAESSADQKKAADAKATQEAEERAAKAKPETNNAATPASESESTTPAEEPSEKKPDATKPEPAKPETKSEVDKPAAKKSADKPATDDSSKPASGEE